jgi:hypothetical protein
MAMVRLKRVKGSLSHLRVRCPRNAILTLTQNQNPILTMTVIRNLTLELVVVGKADPAAKAKRAKI